MSSTTIPASFRLERRPLDLRFRMTRLAARQWLTPGYVRVRLVGEDLRGFDSLGADDHIRVFFPDSAPETVEQLRAAPSREYTPLGWDAEAGWLDLEFAIHGRGVAASWAATAELGAVAGVGGPRGSMIITGRPDGWLLAGDETAVPAMRRYARSMDAASVGRIIVEVADADHELPIDAPAGVIVEQLHRGTDAAGVALARRLNALTPANRPDGDVFAFVAAEQAIVKPARALLQERWALPTDAFVTKGYWKRGESEYHAPH
ncbi:MULTISPECIES: siderophore-interacting protein [unclassified Microbacterium]|uniref:siderophore-interacting protein n=1 Tax=unclassified Microbacterium TaxID=2609290 RepID=UPI00214C5A12|nr:MULTISPECIES: siderophore-interacting protein [unclassified Microbacterium]MCR2783669.1 siderophore-interacting protein [Microbacterium sp. zg.B96]WIM15473.1 siderophore-interacting protein [Microbacterium sp. zg-B96]